MLLSINIREEQEEAISLIVVFDPNKIARKQDKDHFFKVLQQEINKSYNQLVVQVDLNGIVGNRNEAIEKLLGEIRGYTNGDGIIELSQSMS